MYQDIKSEQHLLGLIDKEPPWDFFLYEEITDQLFHLKGHSNLLVKYQPKSVEDLAMILAIMRPGKAYLQQHDWDRIKREVWLKIEGEESYQFKRSHGVAYSLAIIVNLNLLIEKMSSD